MFGLESNKKKKGPEEFFFELEKEMKSPEKQKEIKEKIEARLQKIKDALRTGEADQEEFNRWGLILHGYSSLIKVLSRVTKKKG